MGATVSLRQRNALPLAGSTGSRELQDGEQRQAPLRLGGSAGWSRRKELGKVLIAVERAQLVTQFQVGVARGKGSPRNSRRLFRSSNAHFVLHARLGLDDRTQPLRHSVH